MSAHAPAHGHGGHAAPPPPEPSGVRARAVVFEEAGRATLRDVELRVPASDEATIATTYSSISSGTERLVYGGRLPGFPFLRFPLVPGYEAVGIVEAVGTDVRDVAVGDAVFVGGSHSYVDALGLFGGQSARLHKRASQLVPLHGIPQHVAPLIALAATSRHGVARLGEVRGKKVGVLGMGAIGAFAAHFLALSGAEVVCCDRVAARLEALPAGATAVDLSSHDLEAAVSQADAFVEATGDSTMIAACARTLKPGGAIALLSYYDELRTPYVDCFIREVSLLVAREWQHDDLLAARDALASGAIDAAPLAAHVVPIEAYAEAYETAFHDSRVPKVILSWA